MTINICDNPFDGDIDCAMGDEQCDDCFIKDHLEECDGCGHYDLCPKKEIMSAAELADYLSNKTGFKI